MVKSARRPWNACDGASGSSADSLEKDDMLGNFMKGGLRVPMETPKLFRRVDEDDQELYIMTSTVAKP